MKWLSVYLVGYVIFMAGAFLALWKWGILDDLGSTWSLILGLVVLGIGIMISVSSSGRKETIELDSR